MAIISVTSYGKIYRYLLVGEGEDQKEMENTFWEDDRPEYPRNLPCTTAQGHALDALSGGNFWIRIAEDGTMIVEKK